MRVKDLWEKGSIHSGVSLVFFIYRRKIDCFFPLEDLL